MHVFDGKSLKLRHIDVLDLVALNPLFGTRLDVLQVPDGHILKWWEVDIDLRSQESVHLSFALELRGKFGCRHLCSMVKDLSLSSGSRYLVGVGVHRQSRCFDGNEV